MNAESIRGLPRVLFTSFVDRMLIACFAALVILGVSPPAWSQTSQTYAYQNNAFVWDDPSGSSVATVWDSTNSYCSRYPNSPNSRLPGDDVKADVTFPAGFKFRFNGVDYTSVRVLTNGMLQFGADAGFHRDYTPAALPITAPAGWPGGSAIAGCVDAVPTNLLLAYWRDIDAARNASGASQSSVRTEMLGGAPNRRFVVTWKNTYLYGVNTIYNFQVVFYEGPSPICQAIAPSDATCLNGEFEYRYTNGSSDGTSATVGVQLSTTDYTQYSYNQSFIDTTNGTNLHWYPAPPAAQQPLAAEYRFDESNWTGVQGEARDTSGNGLHGIRVGSANTSNTQYKICRAMAIPNNTSNATIDALAMGNPVTASGYSPGTTGAATFWYRPDVNGSDAMLLDATVNANRPFFIMRRSNNAIRFSLSDSAGTVVTADTGAVTAANTWIHVAVSWKIAAGTNATVLQIFINGTLNVVVRGTTNGALAALARPAYVGDNRTSGVTPSGGTGNSARGYIDELRLYGNEISVVQARWDYLATRASCSVLDHFDISINGTTGSSATQVSALTCEQVGVTITARDIANNPVVIAANAAISVDTNHGAWMPVSGVSSFTSTGNGGATFTFNNSSTASFQFNNRWAETASLHIDSGGINERAVADPSLVTTHEGLRFVTSATGAAVATSTSYQGTSCTDQTIYVQSMKTDQSTFSCVANTGASGKMGSFRNGGTPTLSLAVKCVDPTSCLSTGKAIANGVTLPLGSANATPVAANYADITMPTVTNNNAVAAFPFRFRDSGKIQLFASYNYQDSNGLTVTVRGDSPEFAVGPNGFAFCNVKNGATSNPAATTLAGGLFARAGETFTSDIWALACGSAATVCSSYADAAACVSAQDCAGNFGQETTVPTNNKHGGGAFSLSGTLVAPAPAPAATAGHWVAPAFVSGAPSFTSGAAAGVQLKWDEVGAMIPMLNLSGFFGSTLTYGGGSTTVGRFAPYQFTFGQVPGCSASTPFNYSDQPFTGSITAQSKSGTTTENYDNSSSYARAFAKTVTVSDTFGAAGSYVNNTRAASDFVAGVAAFPAASAANAIKWTFTSPPQAPVTLTQVARDGDQAADVVSTLNVRSGRVRLENAYGSSALALPVPLRTEYWSGTLWLTNAIDSCSYTPWTLSPATPIALTGSGTTNVTLNPGLASGIGTLTLSAPGVPNAGYVDLTLTVPGYLQYNWKGAGAANPTARASFGLYKGSDKVIQRREVR